MSDASGTILVVDDLASNVRLLEAMLGSHGYEVVSAESGLAGLDAVARNEPDLVLLDINLPDIDGFEVCRRIREDSKTRLLPVVMVTSSDEPDKVRAIDAGADDVIVRPFNAPELFSRVKSLLRIKVYHDTIVRQSAELAEWNAKLEERVQTQLTQLEGLDRLRRFFSPEVADVIMSGGERLLETHRAEVTIVFCDLREFTAFSASAEPEDVMAVLKQFYECVGRQIFQAGATLEMFAGDSVMSIFNDPVPCDSPTEKAVRMAIAIRDEAAGLAQEWRLKGFDLDVGIGIADGHATLGRVGFEGRFDYRATGSVVNLAARLCAQAHGGQILLSSRAYASIADIVDAEPVGPLALKGFAQPVHGYAVRSLALRDALQTS